MVEDSDRSVLALKMKLKIERIQFQLKNVLFHLLLSRTTFMMNNERGLIYNGAFYLNQCC